VALRRLVRGPLRPAWTWRQEATVRYLRWLACHLSRRPIGRMQALVERMPAPLGRLSSRVELRSVDVGSIPGEWIVPREGDSAVTLYYLHGGGYVLCSVATHRHLIARLCLVAQARALGINYRLGPQHPFPAALDDAVAGYRWLLQHQPARRIIIAGDSAGGGLAVATMIALRRSGDPLPAGAVLLSPWVDLASEDDSLEENAHVDYLGGDPRFLDRMAGMYLGGADRRDPLASPVHGDLRGLPPLLIQAGGVEMLLDQAERLAQRARSAGVDAELQVWPNMVHVWQAFGGLFARQAREALVEIGSFVRRVQ